MYRGSTVPLSICSLNWKAVSASNTDMLAIPENLEDKVAAATEGFSFAYLQEMWVSALMSMVGSRQDRTPELDERGSTQESVPAKLSWTSLWSSGSTAESKEGGAEARGGDVLWKTIEAQISILKKEMRDSKMSVEDAQRNTSTTNARAGDARRGAGFGR